MPLVSFTGRDCPTSSCSIAPHEQSSRVVVLARVSYPSAGLATVSAPVYSPEIEFNIA